MELITSLDQIEHPLTNPVLTIGNFDGVHEGHKALFSKVIERAHALNGQSAVMTFDPHPIRVMKPGNGPPLITPTEQKLELIGMCGIDVILCLPFTRGFAALSAEDFVNDVLVKRLGIRELVVGYDYSFGAYRKGDITLLRNMGGDLGFKVHVVAPVTIDGFPVSSTSIRDLILNGDLVRARQLLGRDYEIRGRVVRGQGRGASLLGFPTANLDPEDELVPRKGVYAVAVHVDGLTFRGVTNIGINPTFGNGAQSIETHLLDYSGDLLGRTIRIVFLERLRDEKTFKSPKDLSDQITRDIQSAAGSFKHLDTGTKGEPRL